MIFAICDLISYRRQLGRYQPERLQKRGFRRATAQNFQSASGRPETGDALIIHTRVSMLSWLIMFVTDSPASHVVIVTPPRHVVDVTTAGVFRRPLVDLLDGKSFILHRPVPDATPDQRQHISQAAEERIGADFAWGTAATLGLRHVLGITHSSSNLRLYTDVALMLLLLGNLRAERYYLPAVAYLACVAANRTAPHTIRSYLSPRAVLSRLASPLIPHTPVRKGDRRVDLLTQDQVRLRWAALPGPLADLVSGTLLALGLLLEKHEAATAADVHWLNVLGGDSVWASMSGVNLGLMLWSQGQLEKAEIVLDRVVSAKKQDPFGRAVKVQRQLRDALDSVMRHGN